MENALLLSGPVIVLLLVIVGAWELIRVKRKKQTGTPLAATFTEEFTAFWYGTKRVEFEHRDTMSMMREDEAQGAPPDTGVDLDTGVVRLATEQPVASNDITSAGTPPRSAAD